MPAIPYVDRLAHDDKVPGAAAVIHHPLMGGSDFAPEGDGTYLGTVYRTSESGQLVDVIEVSDDNFPGADACEYAGRGSSAVLAGGSVTGPFVGRNNVATDYPQDIAGTVRHGQSQIRWLMTERLILESQLGVQVDPSSTLCMYAAVPEGSTPEDLASTFDIVSMQ